MWATSARTTTPRPTAAASAFSSSMRSNRKMTMSMVFFARLIATSSGAMPSSGWVMSFTVAYLVLGFLSVHSTPMSVLGDNATMPCDTGSVEASKGICTS